MTTLYEGHNACIGCYDASSEKVYDFIDLRIDTQACDDLSMVGTSVFFAVCVGHEQMPDFHRNLTLIDFE